MLTVHQPTLVAVALTLFQLARGQIFRCQPHEASTHCYHLQGIGKCCLGEPLQPIVSPDQVSFLVFNRTSNRFDTFSPEHSHIERCVFILVHGHMSSSRAKWLYDVARRINRVGQCLVQKNEFATSGSTRGIDTLQGTVVNYNTKLPHLMVAPTVLVVDWARPAAAHYEQAAPNARAVGRALGTIMASSHVFGTWRPKIHCIGQGLGAHVCGIAGSVYGDFKRITALDPARPLFEDSQDGIRYHPSQRLDRNDAAFVDVIHTTAQLGFQGTVGHVDFFVNGYRNGTEIRNSQPFCSTESDVNRTRLCSQNRAHEIFRDSFMKRCYFGKCSDAPQNLMVRKCELGWRSYKCYNHGIYCGSVGANPITGEMICADSDTGPQSPVHLPWNQPKPRPRPRPLPRPKPRPQPRPLPPPDLDPAYQHQPHQSSVSPSVLVRRKQWPLLGSPGQQGFLRQHNKPYYRRRPGQPSKKPGYYGSYSGGYNGPASNVDSHEPVNESPNKQQVRFTWPVFSLFPETTTTAARLTTGYKRFTWPAFSTNSSTAAAAAALALGWKKLWSGQNKTMVSEPSSSSSPPPLSSIEAGQQARSLKRFKKLRGNCRGIAIGTAPLELTLGDCADACLMRRECAGFSYYIEHHGSTAPCILKATGCPNPEPALFTFFRRLPAASAS